MVVFFFILFKTCSPFPVYSEKWRFSKLFWLLRVIKAKSGDKIPHFLPDINFFQKMETTDVVTGADTRVAKVLQ